MADRYTYLPGIGLFVIAAWGVHAIVEAHPERRRLATGAAVALLAICTALSHAQARHWRDSVSLFTRAITVTGGNALAHYNLGQALRGERGATREALPHLREAIRISPTYADAHWALGTALIRLGDTAAGMQSLREAARLDPTHVRTRIDLATALVQAGDEKEAIARLREAVTVRPDSALALNNLAWLLATASVPELRNSTQATSLARSACELTANQDPGFLATLAVAQAEAGDRRGALATAQTAHERAIAIGADDAARAIAPMIEAFEAGEPYDARAVVRR